jgi:hypothetical protein
MRNVERIGAAALLIAGMLCVSGPALAAAADPADDGSAGTDARPAVGAAGTAAASDTPVPDAHKKHRHHHGRKKTSTGGNDGASGDAAAGAPSDAGADQ